MHWGLWPWTDVCPVAFIPQVTTLPCPQVSAGAALSFTGIWCGHHSLASPCSRSAMVIGGYKAHQGMMNYGFYFSMKESFGPWIVFFRSGISQHLSVTIHIGIQAVKDNANSPNVSSLGLFLKATLHHMSLEPPSHGGLLVHLQTLASRLSCFPLQSRVRKRRSLGKAGEKDSIHPVL